MARLRSKTGLFVTIVVLGIVLVVVGAIVLTKKPQETSTKSSVDTSKEVSTTKNTSTETDSTDTASTSQSQTTPSTVDPETLTSIDVEPLGVSVFYSKGTPGFEFQVLKTADQTQYVEFTSSDLVGTKCTDDQGAFASIIKNPSTSETQTTSQTVKIGSDTYGLSLASAGCTSNDDLLNQYQDGFKNGFSSLKAL